VGTRFIVCPNPELCQVERFATPGLVQQPSRWYIDSGAIAEQWESTAGKYYEVQYCNDLTNPVWIAVVAFTMPVGFPPITTYYQQIYPCDNRFVRVMTTQ